MTGDLRVHVRAMLPESVLRLWRRYYWWRAAHISPRRARKVAGEWLARGIPVRLEIGSGPRLPGWVTLDRNPAAHVQHDLNAPLPFPDASVDEIYSSHVFEHFSYPTPLLAIVRECHRVLRTGGTIRVAVPDASIYLRAYADPAAFDRERFCSEPVGLSWRNRMDVVNFIAYLGADHKYMFDQENLLDLLTEAGFRAAQARAFDGSIDRAERAHESVYAIAHK